jgi:F-type H+-transporting ATPase subunit b
MMWFLFSTLAWAEEHAAEAVHGHGGPTEIPWSSIAVQAFNLIFLLVVLGFILRKAIKAHFAQRAQSFKELVDRAENARREAEQSRRQIQERLAKLESSAAESVSRARSEAEELKSRLMMEAKGLAQKFEQEARRSAQVELEKPKTELRKELLHKALAVSEEKLKKGLGSTDQKNLQNEFAEKIEVVSR